MDCPCPVCTNRVNFEDSNSPEEVVEVDRSAYDMIQSIIDEFKLPKELVIKLEDVQMKIDEVDSKFVKLQEECIRRPIDLTQFRLGEISKELY